MLCRRSLHEPTDVANSERHVRPHIDEVAKVAHNAPVPNGVDLLGHAVVAQLQPLHGSAGSQVNDALGVGGEGDAVAVLVDLDPMVEGEKAQVAHLEGRLHLLAHIYLSLLGAGDHQVADVEAYQ